MKIIINKQFEFQEGEYLWKYLDLHKFISFLIEKELHFARLDQLEDPLEGLTEKVLSEMSFLAAMKNPDHPNWSTEKSEMHMNEIVFREKLIKEEINLYKKSNFVDSWFISKKESWAMWKLYSNPDAIAIRYDSKYLVNKIITAAKKQNEGNEKLFICGLVEYDNIWPFDYFKESNKKIENVTFKKDSSYFHENEFRFSIAIQTSEIDNYDFLKLPLGEIKDDALKIFAHPMMDNWKFKNLKKLLDLEEYKISNKLFKSELIFP